MRSWQPRTVYFFEEAPFFRLLLPVLAAIISYDQQWLPSLCVRELALATLVAGTVAFSLVLKKGSGYLKAIPVYITLFFLGWFICEVRDVQKNPRWFGAHLSHADAFLVKADEDAVKRSSTWRVMVSVLKGHKQGKSFPVAGKAFLYLYKSDEPVNIRAGDTILVPNKWMRIKNAGNPAEFDFARFSARNNIYFQQFLSREEIEVIRQARASGPDLVSKLHFWGMDALAHHIHDSATLGLMQAMLLGDDVNFDPALRKTYSNTGIVHIVAISGSHVMVFFYFVSLFFFWIRNKRYVYLRYLLALPLVVLYVLIAGAPISAVRAAIMFSFLAFGLILNKNRHPLNQLFATAFFMLIYEPMWLFSVGFQLSFTAVLSLILFFQRISKLLYFKNKLFAAVWQVAAASLSAEILIAPIVIFYFHLLPAMFLIANVFAYLFMSIVLLLGITLILLSSFGWLASSLALVLIWLTTGFHFIIGLLQEMNPDLLHHLHFSLAQIVIIYLVITGVALALIQKKFSGWWVASVSAMLFLFLSIHHRWTTLRQRQFIVYNVSKKAYAEILSGGYYYPLFSDSTLQPDQNFATKEIHTATGNWREGATLQNAAFKVGEETLLILREPPPDTTFSLSVDYLLLAYPVGECRLEALQTQFHFKKVVIASNTKRHYAQRWRDSCRSAGVPLHSTSLDGAFVVSH